MKVVGVYSLLVSLPEPTTAAQPPGISDADLVEAIKSGQSWAGDALYRRYARPIGSMATRLLANRQDAEDVVHDTFVKALQKIRTLREPARVRGWLFRIAVSECRGLMRKRKVRNFVGFHLVEDASLSSMLSPSADGEVRAELVSLDQALRMLSANKRIAWMLRHVEGRALNEIADHCDCSLATVKRRLQSASTHMRKHVEAGL